MFDAVIFDVGHTLVDYKNPLNWSSLYGDALTAMYQQCGMDVIPEKLNLAVHILSKYNTRINPRKEEVSCEQIFKEIFKHTGDDFTMLNQAIASFFDFFQNGAVLYDDVRLTLSELKNRDIKIGVLTDVAYGMDRERALQDFKEVESYIDLWFTSVDIGYRKPEVEGFLCFSKKWNIAPGHMLYVGDEEKDVLGANRAGMASALIERHGIQIDYGQTYTLHRLNEILKLIEERRDDKSIVF